ncbi:MAG: ATP-dependent helicase HrpB [Bacteroidota bacterium]
MVPRPQTTPLPIDTVLEDVRAAMRSRPCAVLQAPPGAGKTTRVPLALLDEAWLGTQRIVMLEPRRLAARAAARRMAHSLGERVGQTVGYRIRREVKVGAQTRIEVVTEGILTRMLQSDPTLDGVGLLIFDEYHERSLAADLGLAFALDAHHGLREDLRLLVMSATLDGERIAALMADEAGSPAPIVTSRGRAFPVETRYVEAPARRSSRRGGASGVRDLPERMSDAIREALADEPGSVLAFLPGVGEIRRTEALLRDGSLPADVRLAPLYGALDQRAQDAAIEPAADGVRKVVLATPIAETSLTIEGVRVVVDGGYARTPRFSPRTGMTRLETVRISAASADQRRGRAGRTEPGVCIRLWGPLEQAHLAAFTPPETVLADLAPLALELAAWGITDATSLRWLDPPPDAALSQARDLLRDLGALDRSQQITQRGRQMVRLGLHPRMAALLIEGKALGLGATACAVAALLGERDPLRAAPGTTADADLRLRLDVLRSGSTPLPLGHRADPRAVQTLRAEAAHLRRRLSVPDAPLEAEAAGLLVALAYPDRIAQRMTGRRYRLRTGHQAALSHDQPLADAEYLAVAALDDRPGGAKLFLAAPLALDDIEAHFGDQIREVDVVTWDAESERVVARRQAHLGALVLRDAPLPDPSPDAVTEALLDGLCGAGIEALSWSKEAQHLQDRLRFLHAHRPEAWHDVSDAALLDTLADWLGPHVYGLRRLADVRKLDLDAVLRARLDWPQQQALDRLAPSHLRVPSGSNLRVDYSEPEAPVLAVKLQEVFGWTETPRLLDGTIPVTMHLLSPARRPVQVTQDLAGFWASSYFDVRKDLRGRYPKHPWPENPLEATPTARTKRRRS